MGGKSGYYPDPILLGLFVTLETAVTPLLKGGFPTFSNTLPSILLQSEETTGKIVVMNTANV